MMDVAYHSDEAKEINKNIFETIYHASLERSYEISRERCDLVKSARTPNEHCTPEEFGMSMANETYGSYSSFIGSPASKGVLQFDLWDTKPHSNRYNWESLKNNIVKYGLRNSLCVAPMPTASTVSYTHLTLPTKRIV